ncbi:rCG38546 [Rattus norvegicus]|uniref:RCG38546 n=1 Tax=Rattus norvegicus TaxID=10116 RepID=A6KM76_RAT|nr:rCG38546 [Rattus norvegicus]
MKTQEVKFILVRGGPPETPPGPSTLRRLGEPVKEETKRMGVGLAVNGAYCSSRGSTFPATLR